MQTTLDLEPAVLNAARQLAAHHSISLGRAISELARKGLARVAEPARTGHRFPVFRASPGAKAMTLKDVKQHLDDESQ